LRLPPVSVQASGIPPPSTRRWCLLPRRPRSTGLGPVLRPPFRLRVAGVGDRALPLELISGVQFREQQLVQLLPDARLAARRVACARLSSRSRSRAPAAGALSRSRCGARTRCPARPCDHPAACDLDSESGAASSEAAARSAATARLAPPTASPSIDNLHQLDDRCRRRSRPGGGSLRLHRPRSRRTASPAVLLAFRT
jgi:hypothetical protein